MSTIHLTATTTATPSQFVAGLTDFGPTRSQLFPAGAGDSIEVHTMSLRDADVTERSHGVWERVHYDWSDLNHVVLATTDSDVWGGHSGQTYTLTPQADGRTEVDVVVVREGKNLKGKVLAGLAATVGRRRLSRDLQRTVRAIEDRNRPPAPDGTDQTC